MAGTNIKDNKAIVKEDVLIFEKSNTKIITGVSSEDLTGDTLRDMTLNPGDMIFTTDNGIMTKTESGFQDGAGGSGGGGLDEDLFRVFIPTGPEDISDNEALNVVGDGDGSYVITTAWRTPEATPSKNVTISSGTTLGAASNTGSIDIPSGTAQDSGNTGNVTIATGNTTIGSVGNI